MILDESIRELTKLLIKQDLKDRETEKEKITIAKVDLIRFCIKLLKLLKKY